MNWKWILVVILLLVLIVFTAQNYAIVEIEFLVWSFQTSRTIIVFCSLAAGLIIGLTVSLGARKRE